MATVGELATQAIATIDGLARLGEEVADEWQYVADLQAVWSARLREVADARGDAPAAPPVEDAVAAASDEASSISDPHRAIDWLSTYPQVVLLALGEAG